tara:strand:+ start:420 stop:746 length:327 start_codon:yes stop_codon:yes gene_type:complete
MVSDVPDDDDKSASLCIPVNRLRRIDYNGTVITLYFDNIRFPANPSTQVGVDTIGLQATTLANGKAFADKIVEAISVGEDIMIIVVDRAGAVYLDEDMCYTVTAINVL